MRYAVAEVVEALCYMPESHRFDPDRGLQDFSLTYSFRPHFGPKINAASNKNEYQGSPLRGKDNQCVVLTTLPPENPASLNLLEPLGPIQA
jgi:hypothetical protein